MKKITYDHFNCYYEQINFVFVFNYNFIDEFLISNHYVNYDIPYSGGKQIGKWNIKYKN